jgi:nucleotide-binding universal stress UspA family protein
VRYAKHLATVFEARLRLLHVVTPVPQTIYYDGAGLPQFVFPPSMMDDEVRSAMERFYASADGPSAAVELDVEHGAAVEGILRSASMHEADLLLMASHGLTGLSHLMMGSVAERVVRRAGCPVFTVKSFGRSLIIDGESPAAIAGVSR